MKPIFRESNTVFIGISSLLIMKTNNLASFSGGDSYVVWCIKVCGYKNVRFLIDCKNIHLICSILVAVNHEDYHSQSD